MIAVITINVDPSFQLGPVEGSWHGLMTALGILAGAWLAARYARERELDTEPLFSLVLVIVAAGVLGAKLLYVAQHDVAALLEPIEWLRNEGFSIYGGLVGGGLAAGVWIWARGLSPRYLDALAAGLPLALVVGRIGDLINGEHYGPATDLPWGIIYSHPDAPVPSHDVAYHPGGLYEVVLSLAILAVLWPLRNRFQRPTTLLWTTLAAYAGGRFLMFFWRDDASAGIAGINSAQLESLGLAIVALGALLFVSRLPRGSEPPTDSNLSGA